MLKVFAMEMKDAKLYGGIGAILQLVGPFVPSIGFILALVGLVLVFLAVKTISEKSGDEGIFNNYLKAFIAQILGIIIFVGIIVATIGTAILKGGMGKLANPMEFMSLIGTILLGFIILWIFYTVAGYFKKKSYELIAQYTGTDMFKTAGLLFFIGAILIILGIGVLIILIAEILEIVAFFSLPETSESAPVSA
ncbi:MAG: hypothetical protein PWP39_1178 [Pyrococcus sp.]|nr:MULTISPECIES: DUF996 domain-containing protein [Pyrococcus]MDK2869943.1 hypothetical protein [Pyrococcus sp.]